MNQNYTSANTSINKYKIPKIYNIKTISKDITNKSVIDIGGGKFDNAKVYAKEKYNCDVSIYDKFNRTFEHNKNVLSKKYDIALCSNVLNVIDSKNERLNIIKLALKHSNILYITIYKGNGSKIGKVSKKDCWQENRPLKDYIDEIKEIENINIELFSEYIKITNYIF